MAQTIELMTIREICEMLDISRNTFYVVYKKYATQIPSTKKEALYDKQSVLDAYKKVKGVEFQNN